MSRPLFGFRPNLRNKAHRRAWKILQAVPEGRKNAFLVQAILEQKDPDDEDVEFFNKYTAEIYALREKLEELQQQLNG